MNCVEHEVASGPGGAALTVLYASGAPADPGRRSERGSRDSDPACPEACVAGYVHSIFPGSTVDGPGIRLVVFLGGCRMRCRYCHNPDTWRVGGGRRMTLDEVMAAVKSYAGFLRAAGGGVTISGGEPLVQHGFAVAIARRVRAMNLNVALDTNGLLGDRLTDDELGLFDLVLLDLKESDPARHLALTRQPLEPVLAFARRLERLGRPAWVRFVLVPGVTDSDDTLRGVRGIVDGLSNVRRVDVLPFHQMGRYKWQELGLTYTLDGTPTPTAGQVDRAREILCGGKGARS